MSMLWYELRYALRLIRKSPGFVSLCVMIIAMGMGLSIVMYSSIKSAAYADLPVANGERFVSLLTLNRETRVESAFQTMDAYAFKYLCDNLQGFDTIQAYRTGAVTLSDGSVAERFTSAEIEPLLLAGTGAKPLLGRALQASDAELGSEKVVVLGHNVWQNYYASDAGIVGKLSRINGQLHTIVGVMEKGFKFPVTHDLWLPYRPPVDVQPSGERNLDVVGVLSASTTLADADRQVREIFASLARQFPESYGDREAMAVPYVQAFLANAMLAIYMLIAVTITVLVLVSINVGNLLLIRANERVHELAIRNALGASRARLAQQVLLESLLVCLLGGIVGLCFADLSLQVIRTEYILSGVGSSFLPFWFDFRIDTQMILVSTAAVLAMWLIAGGSAAARVIRNDLSEVLEGGNKGSSTSGKGWLGKALVGMEVVLSSFLLIVSGALVVAIQDAGETDFGTASEGYMTANVSLPADQYAGPQSRLDYFRNLEQEIGNISGVEGVALTTALPSQSALEVRYNLDDRDLMRDNRYPTQGIAWISTHYFEVMQVELLQGRGFSPEDDAGVDGVVIVDEYFARQMWPGENVVGKRIHISPGSGGEWLRIIGVTPHIIQGQPLGLEKTRTTLYRHIAQATPAAISMAVRVSGEPASYLQAIKRAAQAVDREVPVEGEQALDDLIQSSIGAVRVLGQVFMGVAFVTLLLGAVGIFGIVSRAVVVRTSEMGIRRALGLTDMGVRMTFLKEGLWYLGSGIVIGGGLGVITTSMLADVFTEVMGFLPYVLIVVSISIGFVILMACHIPAKRIVRLEPSAALRYDA